MLRFKTKTTLNSVYNSGRYNSNVKCDTFHDTKFQKFKVLFIDGY